MMLNTLISVKSDHRARGEVDTLRNRVVHHENQHYAVAGAAHAVDHRQIPERPRVFHLPLENSQPQLGHIRIEFGRNRIILGGAVG